MLDCRLEIITDVPRHFFPCWEIDCFFSFSSFFFCLPSDLERPSLSIEPKLVLWQLAFWQPPSGRKLLLQSLPVTTIFTSCYFYVFPPTASYGVSNVIKCYFISFKTFSVSCSFLHLPSWWPFQRCWNASRVPSGLQKLCPISPSAVCFWAANCSSLVS